MNNKKQRLTRFDIYGEYDLEDLPDGCNYDADEVHEAIKKSINNESIEMIKADLEQYFGLKL